MRWNVNPFYANAFVQRFKLFLSHSVAMLLFGWVLVISLCVIHISIATSALEGKQISALPLWYPSVIATIRLLPGDDLKLSLLTFAKIQRITSGSIVTAVGSIESVRIRLASASSHSESEYLEDLGKYEIVSLVGTMEYNAEEDASYGHFHISLADSSGRVIGGHLLDGCKVFTTVEIVIMHVPNVQYTRVLDTRSGYKELNVQEIHAFM